ncbi:MAG: thioredoxin family protein [Chitinophagales bacterium]|nr:thioredoxin family protein [Chitinophagales bacterium]
MDTIAKGEFINGVCKINCKDYPKGLYQLVVIEPTKATFLLLGNSNISVRYESEKKLTPKPVFENSEPNRLLQKILIQNEQYFLKRDSLSRLGQSIYEFDVNYKGKVDSLRMEYDQLHEENNAKLDAISRQTTDEYLSGVLIPVLKFTVFNKEADKAKYDSERAFQHFEFFRNIDFSKKQLVDDYFFAQKLNEYINYFGGRSTKAKQESCAMLLRLTDANREVQKFTMATLMEAYFNTQDLEMVEYVINSGSAESCEASQFSGELKNYFENVERLIPGQTAPEISLKDPAGSIQLLSSTVKSNKYTVVFFWGSWCPHCLDILHKLKNLYPELKAKEAEVFAVALDDSYEAWVQALAQYNAGWINVSERKKWDTKAAEDYNVRATPILFLITGEMKIVGKYITIEELKSAWPKP